MSNWNIVFRSLTFGAKFDFKRFHNDAEKLKILKPINKHEHQTLCINESNKETRIPDNEDRKRKQSASSANDEFPVTGKRRKTDDAEMDLSKTAEGDDSNSDSSDAAEDHSIKNNEDAVDEDDDARSKYEVDSEDESESDDESNDDNSEDDENESEDEEDSGDGDRDDSKHVIEKKRKKKVTDTSAAKLAQIKQEQVNHFRNERHMQLYGEDIPDPVATFEQLAEEYAISPKIMENLRTMGFTTPTEIETQAIPIMLQRREIIACAPTGSGKTLAFVLPILHHLREPTKKRNSIRALVLAPTIELAKQIHREFTRVGEGLGFRVEFIEKVVKVLKQATKKPKKVDVLVTTPNRLVYLMKENPAIMSLSSVEWLVIDECDKLFEDGESGFRDQLGTIYKACNSKDIRRGLFSATFANDVKEWCLLNLDNVIQVYVGARNAATHVIEQELIYAGNESGKLMALRELIRKGFQPPVLIFVQSKDRAKDLFHELFYDKANVEVIHGDKTQAQRDKVVAGFRSGKIWILICTEVLGRGIDFKGVNLVINYDFPNSAVSYIHRIGRTGRAGRPGKAITFFTDSDVMYLKSIVNVMREAGCEVPDYMLQLKAPNKNRKKTLARSEIKREPINMERFLVKEMKKGKKSSAVRPKKKIQLIETYSFD